jgi:hypothetical protein
MKRFLLSAVAALALGGMARSLMGSDAGGSVGAPYLEMPMGARATGMGEAFSGIANDTEAMYYNPAGLTQVDGTAASFMHMQGFGGINYEHLAIAAPAENLGIDVWGTLGISYTNINMSNIQRSVSNAADTVDSPGGYSGTDPGGFSQEYWDHNFEFGYSASVFGLSYAWQATKSFSLGVTGKYMHEELDDKEGNGFAADAGMFINSPLMPGVGAGLVLQNVGVSPLDGSLPMQLRAGLGYKFDHPFSPSYWPVDELNTGLDIVLPISPAGQPVDANVGLEYKRWFGNNAGALRAGYRYPDDLGAVAGFTAGCGYSFDFVGALVSLDYAFVPYGDLGVSHRISLSGVFGGKPRPTPMPPKISQVQGVQAVAGDRSAQIYWHPNSDEVQGYNLYMAYKAAGPWYKLNKQALKTTSQHVGSLYNGVTTYFYVAAVSKPAGPGGPSGESSKSVIVGIVPRPGGSMQNAPAAPALPPVPAAAPKASSPPALPALPVLAPTAKPTASAAPGLPPLPGAPPPAKPTASAAPGLLPLPGAPPSLPPLP